MSGIREHVRELVEAYDCTLPGEWTQSVDCVVDEHGDWVADTASPHIATFMVVAHNTAPDIARTLLEACQFIDDLSTHPSKHTLAEWRNDARDFLNRIGGVPHE